MAQHWILAMYSFVIFQGDPDQYCIEPYIFVIFQGRGVRLPMRGYRNFCQARLSENSSEVFSSFFFNPQLWFFTVLQRVSNGYFKEDYTFPRFQRESNIFQGGGVQRGPNAYFYRNPYNLSFSRGGSPDPYPPSWPAHAPCTPLDPRMNYREKTPI